MLAGEYDPAETPMNTEMPKQKKQASVFEERLLDLRKKRGLSQVELARRIGSTQRAISYYEVVAAFPPAEVLVQIAQALRVSTDELLISSCCLRVPDRSKVA